MVDKISTHQNTNTEQKLHSTSRHTLHADPGAVYKHYYTGPYELNDDRQ